MTTPKFPKNNSKLGNKLNRRLEWFKVLLQLLSAFFKEVWINYKRTWKAITWKRKLQIVVIDFFILLTFYLFSVDINLLGLFGKSPGLLSIRNPDQSVASELYSADGQLLGKYFKENRTPVSYNEIAPILVKTLIATEDERFYKHFGIDIQGIFAAMKDMASGNGARGASTITQQLVKNMFKTRSQYSKGLIGRIPGVGIIVMKSKEWITAIKIEMFYSKEEILTMYLNTVDFGSNAYGIKTACKTYFNNKPSELTIEQSATLVGLLKATTTYNPRINPKTSLKRRNIVLENLLNQRLLKKADYDSIKKIPIQLNFKIERNFDGNALYFREAVVAYLEDWCKENDVDIYSDGLKIYTTVDTRMQKYAEEAVDKQMRIVQNNFDEHWGKQNPWRDKKNQEIPGFIENIAKNTALWKSLTNRFSENPDSVDFYMNLKHPITVYDYKEGKKTIVMSTMDSIRYMERFMHTGFVAIEPQTGFVKAWVGDINFNFWKYDKVLSKRQPGSTFKLFVYSEAFNKGMGPCDLKTDQSITWDVIEKGEPKVWIPHNANGNFSGQTLTLKAAFARSINSIAVAVAKEVGIKNIIKTAKAMGIKTPLNELPSVCLGSSDVSLLELVNAYSTVINDGYAHEPILITKILDKKGNIVYAYKKNQTKALPYQTAFLMTQMLRAGLTEPMSTVMNLWGYDIHRFGTEFGGKTGTSSNHSDAWFVGVSPNLVGGAWVGGEHRSIHFRTGALGEGSKTAMPIFGYFMEKVLKDPSLIQYRGKFPKPIEEISVPYACQTVYVPIDTVQKDSMVIDLSSPTAEDPGNLEDELN